MRIQYRSKFTGTFLSAKKAAQKKYAKAVVSYLIGDNKKTIGKHAGFYDAPKKLARVALTKLKLPKAKKIVTVPLVDLGDEFLEDLETDEDQWEAFQNDWGELDYMDDLEELMEDEDEWYHHAT